MNRRTTRSRAGATDVECNRLRPPYSRLDTHIVNTAEIMATYLEIVQDHLQAITATETEAITAAAELIADRVIADQLVYAYGPGGHSNLAAQEVFFRAGGLVNVSAILDGGDAPVQRRPALDGDGAPPWIREAGDRRQRAR